MDAEFHQLIRQRVGFLLRSQRPDANPVKRALGGTPRLNDDVGDDIRQSLAKTFRIVTAGKGADLQKNSSCPG